MKKCNTGGFISKYQKFLFLCYEKAQILDVVFPVPWEEDEEGDLCSAVAITCCSALVKYLSLFVKITAEYIFFLFNQNCALQAGFLKSKGNNRFFFTILISYCESL